MIIPNKHDGWVKNVRRVYDSGGGGGGGSSTQVTDLPDWAKPYAQETLEKTKQLSNAPSQTYNEPRFAGFSPMQQKAQDTAFNMGTSGQLGTGTGLATAAGLMGLGANYQPGYFGNQFRAPAQYQPSQFGMMSAQAPDLQQFQMGPAERVQGGQYEAPMMGTAQTGFRPDLQAFQMGPAQQVQAGQYATPEMAAAQTQFRPDLQAFQMGPAERADTQSFTQPGSAEAYMSPFMQNVVDKQTREAERQAGLAAKQERAASIQRGAFGGGRTAVREAAAARDLAQLKSDIYGTGQQAAFQNAQQQFNAEQQARMQAQLANQQAGLTTGQQNLAARLGVQQLGTQTGMQTALANLNNQQQAAVQNQAAQLQTQGMSAQQAMQAALANQQAGLTVGQQNLAAQQATQQLGTQTGLQSALANLSAEQQANVQNQAAQLQTQGLTANQAMQAAMANQQAGLTTGQQNLAAQLGVQQLGSGQNMQAQLANQQAYQNMLQQREASRQFGYGQQMTAAQQRAQFGQAAQQLAEQSRQFGAGYGQQGLNTALQAAGQLGNLGQAEFGQQKDIVGLQSQLGGQQQALRQQGLTQAYQDFLNEQNYPYKQLGFMSDMIRGLPLGQQTTRQMYEAPGSMMGQLGGIGMGLYGMSRMMGAAGGEVKEYADGGEVTSSYNVDNIISKLSDVQLQQARLAAVNSQDQQRLQMIDGELAQRASLRSGLGNAFNSLPEETQESVTEMAGGGIVAFADGGPTQEEIDAARRPFVGYPMAARPRDKQYGESRVLERLGAFMVPPTYAVDKPAAPAVSASAAAPVAPARTSERRDTYRAAPARGASARAGSSNTFNASISQAVEQMADKVGMDRDTFMEKFKELEDHFSKSSREEMKGLLAEAEKNMGGSKKVKEEALGRALAEFGFKWAASAAKPGARFLGSAAEASPTLAASAAESAKLAREMDQNDMKLRLNLKQFEIAQSKDDRRTASTLAAQIRALQQSQEQLGLKRQELAQQGAYQQGSLANQRAQIARGAESDRLRGISAAANLQRAQASILEVGRKAGLDFDNSRTGRDLRKQLTEQHGAEKANYMYNQQRRAYISEATQGARAQAESDVQARNVFDLLGQE